MTQTRFYPHVLVDGVIVEVRSCASCRPMSDLIKELPITEMVKIKNRWYCQRHAVMKRACLKREKRLCG